MIFNFICGLALRLLRGRRRGRAQPGLVVEHVMQIDPESAVEFEDGKRAVGGAGLLRHRPDGSQKGECQEQKEFSAGYWACIWNRTDSSANSLAAQTRDSFFPLFPQYPM